MRTNGILANGKLSGTATFVDADILELYIISNEIKGGDSGHGGFCFIELKTNCDFEVNGQFMTRLRLVFRGDAERRNLRDAFKYMAEYLEQEIGPEIFYELDNEEEDEN